MEGCGGADKGQRSDGSGCLRSGGDGGLRVMESNVGASDERGVGGDER